MLEAVLFDGGDTLVGWRWDERLLEEGHDAGLRALGREPSPALTARFRSGYLPLLQSREELDEVDYAALMRRLLGEFGIEPSGEELDRFLAAEHDAWAPARSVGEGTHALLDALRARGLRLGLVSNTFDPGWLVRRDLAAWGLAERLDVVVLSSEVGKRKPHPEPFERALDALGGGSGAGALRRRLALPRREGRARGRDRDGPGTVVPGRRRPARARARPPRIGSGGRARDRGRRFDCLKTAEMSSLAAAGC